MLLKPSNILVMSEHRIQESSTASRSFDYYCVKYGGWMLLEDVRKKTDSRNGFSWLQ